MGFKLRHHSLSLNSSCSLRHRLLHEFGGQAHQATLLLALALQVHLHGDLGGLLDDSVLACAG